MFGDEIINMRPKNCIDYVTVFQPGFFWLSMTGGGGGIHPPLENNVPVELGQ